MTMRNLEDIQALLDKYWLGETTLEEERTIKGYFAGPVDERFQQYTPLFQTLRQEQAIRFEQAKVVPMPARSSRPIRWAVAASIVALLGLGAWWWSRPIVPSNAVVQAPPIAPVALPPAPVVVPLPKSAVIAVSQPLAPRKHTVKARKPAPVVIDPETEQAMEEIMAALSLVSSKLNKGKKAALKDLNKLENMDKFLKPKSDS